MTTPSPPVSTDTADSATAIESLDLFSVGTVEQLSDGFLAVIEPELFHVQKSLRELM